jgi:ligand-binding sensor domain-containing protein
MFARILLTLLWSLLLYRTMPAQGLKPEAVTIENGLSQGMIFDICQTRDGFLWVATKDGLNRYDGYNFNIFSNDPFDPYSLAENTVTALFEDSRGWLWVGTESKGLDLYDRRSGRFHHFSLNFKRNIKAISFEIHAICEAPDGTIYLLQKGNGLIRVAIPAGWKDRLPAEPDLGLLTKTTLFPIEQFKASGNKNEELLVALQPQKNGDLWVWSNQMPYIVEPGKDIARPLATAQWQEAGSGIRHDTWGAIPYSLVRFRNGQATLPEFPPGLKINWSMVKPAANGDTWVAVNRQLWRLSPGEDLDFSNPDWVTDENISTAATDRNGNIWIGTHGYGLRKFNPKKQLFHTGAAGTSMWGLWRNTRGRYFCKVVNEVFPYDPATGKIGTERAFPDGPKRLLDACIEPSGSFWLLGRGEAENGQAELAHYDPESRLIRRYSFAFNPYVYARILQNREGYLWMTGLNCQLVRFDPKTARFDYFDYASLFGENANTVRAFALEEDGNGVLWIGTQQGLVKGMPNGRSFDFQLIQADSDNPEGLNNNSIACLLADPAEPAAVLWIGTKGGGINRLDLHSGLFQHIKTKDGLPDNVIYGILPGNKDELWCSTNRGLAKLRSRKTTPASFDITTFTAAQGLQDNEFNTQAFFKAPNGELLFGGVNGLNHFFPTEVQPDTASPPVFIVGLRINHKRAAFGNPDCPLGQPLEFLKSLELSHEQNNLSFEFAALDFTDPSKNRYRYRLVGADPDWVEVGTHRFAHFTHLTPGKYTLLVQGNNGEGAWKNAGNPIFITILPPWWSSGIAYLLYALLLIAGGWQAYRFQLRRVQIREQLAFEHRETTRVKALEQMKTNFFSNVTHEFRTPLTLILEPARRILAHSGEPETRENARHIEVQQQPPAAPREPVARYGQIRERPGIPGRHRPPARQFCRNGARRTPLVFAAGRTTGYPARTANRRRCPGIPVRCQ